MIEIDAEREIQRQIFRFFVWSTPSRRKRHDRETDKKRNTKIKMIEKVATNVVASQPPNGDRLQRRPLVPKFVT